MKRYSKYMQVIITFAMVTFLIVGCSNKKEKSQDAITQESQSPEETKIEEPNSEETNEPASQASETPAAQTEIQQTQEPQKTQASEQSNDKTEQKDGKTDSDLKKTEAPKEEQKEPQKELPIYTINETTFLTESFTANIPKDQKITPEFIVETVVSNLKEHEIEVKIDYVKTEGEAVAVSVSSAKPFWEGVGSGVEATVLDCISQSILDNIDSCKKVIFRMDGKEYQTGVMFFDIDEPYSWK